LHNQDYKPEVLISDAADAIYNGFTEVYGDQTRVTCWTHAYRAIAKKLHELIKQATAMYIYSITKISIANLLLR